MKYTTSRWPEAPPSGRYGLRMRSSNRVGRGEGTLVGLSNLADELRGCEIGPVNGIIDNQRVNGSDAVQIGLANLAETQYGRRHPKKGTCGKTVQFGLLNASDAYDFGSKQIGMFNSRKGNGRATQLGLVNYCEMPQGYLQLGVLNITGGKVPWYIKVVPLVRYRAGK